MKIGRMNLSSPGAQISYRTRVTFSALPFFAALFCPTAEVLRRRVRSVEFGVGRARFHCAGGPSAGSGAEAWSSSPRDQL